MGNKKRIGTLVIWGVGGIAQYRYVYKHYRAKKWLGQSGTRDELYSCTTKTSLFLLFQIGGLCWVLLH